MILKIDYFDLDKIYNSGIAPRWQKIKDGTYIVIHQDRILKVSQTNNRVVFDCKEKDFFDLWFDYFDLRTDYEYLHYTIKNIPTFENQIINGKGLHFIGGDIWEALVFSLLEMDFYKSKVTMNYLSSFGEKINRKARGIPQDKYYKFPSAEEILFHRFNIDGIGNKKDLLIYMAKLVDEEKLNLEKLKSMKTQDILYCFKDLLISSNIAKRFCLYGLHRLEIFPLDKSIKKILNKLEMDRKQFFDFYLCDKPKARENIGLFYQYLILDKSKGGLYGFNR